ncbi:accessory Sec system protein Asp1 [Streptococcus pluranimalium]
MFYFIPAWYSQENSWQMDRPYWYRVMNRLVFDDTISQMKLFHDAGEDNRPLFLAYQPQLRYFLHKHGILGISYWSFFDDIQNIADESSRSIDFKELKWPKGASFTYSPFYVHVRVKDEVIATVQFAENGNIHSIDWYQAGLRNYCYIFDDRGFLSSYLVFKDDKPLYQDFLNAQGIWQVREHFSPDTVKLEINPAADTYFSKISYSSWEDLMSERLHRFKRASVTSGDVVIIAAHKQHNVFLGRLFSENTKVYSFYDDRTLTDDDLKTLCQYAQLLLVQGDDQIDYLNDFSETNRLTLPKVSKIPLFDTRLRLGRSQTVAEMRLYFVIDGLSHQELEAVLEKVWPLLAENHLLGLELVTYESTRNMTLLEEDLLDHILASRWAMDLTIPVEEGENQLVSEEKRTWRSVYFVTVTDENQIIAALDTARVVIDLAKKPHHYTQIASLSAGLPQINKVVTPFVENKENGWIITDWEDLAKAIVYYTDGLANWNKALVRTVQKMADYTSGRLMTQWKDTLREIEDGKDKNLTGRR